MPNVIKPQDKQRVRNCVKNIIQLEKEYQGSLQWISGNDKPVIMIFLGIYISGAILVGLFVHSETMIELVNSISFMIFACIFITSCIFTSYHMQRVSRYNSLLREENNTLSSMGYIAYAHTLKNDLNGQSISFSEIMKKR